MKKSTRGFTVVELLIVIIVIAILVTITVVVYNGVQGRARDDRRRSDVANLAKALELYYSDNGSYPYTSTSSGSINGSWYTSDVTASWSAFQTVLTGTIDALPIDPKNTAGNIITTSTAFNYAYFGTTSSTYCNVGAGQMFIIVYRLENSPKEKFSDGSCNGTDLGTAYYTSGLSYYRSVKGG